VDASSDRACRGADSRDNLASYYKLFKGMATLEACKDLCRATDACAGIEFNGNIGRCEVWIRPDGIGATTQVQGYQCLRYSADVALAAADVA